MGSREVRVHKLISNRRVALYGALAAGLPVLSYFNPFLIHGVNSSLRLQSNSLIGWQVYTALRLALFVWLLWALYKMNAPATEGSPTSVSLVRPESFDGLMALRALAALMVVQGHFFLNTFLPGLGPISMNQQGLIGSNPAAAVWIFFTLSGFLMGKAFTSGRYALDERGIRNFMRNRLLRIVPLYYVAMLVVGAFTTPTIFLPHHWWMLVEVLTFDYRGDLPLNTIGPLWSVSTEVQFYFLVPFLIACLIKVRERLGKYFLVMPTVLLVAGTGIMVAVTALLDRSGRDYAMAGGNWFNLIYAPLLPNLFLFLFGMSLNLVLPEKNVRARQRGRFTGILVVVAAVLYIVSAFTARYFHTPPFLYIPMLTALMSGCYILLNEFNGRIEYRSGFRRAFLWSVNQIGVLTYAIYIFHLPMFTSLMTQLGGRDVGRLRTFALFPVMLLVLLSLAAVFHYMLEKPFEERKRLFGGEVADAP